MSLELKLGRRIVMECLKINHQDRLEPRAKDVARMLTAWSTAHPRVQQAEPGSADDVFSKPTRSLIISEEVPYYAKSTDLEDVSYADAVDA
mmetsp:Transcript_10528/g.20599  ORF Transcript_10528/g.20599 Transcript_10528/m.20599 type:complete len:91 (+) Transcript_10528:699-971(+)